MDALNRPKAPPQPCPPHKMSPKNSKQTLRELLTEDETQLHYISLLKEMSRRPTGPWKDYWAFYTANMSGDFETMKPEIKAYVIKLVKELKKEHMKRLTGDDNATEEK